MRKLILVVLALAMVAAACGSTPETSTQPQESVATEAPSATEATAGTEAAMEDPDTTEATTGTAAPSDSAPDASEDDTRALVAEGPDVPGVLLALDNGETLDVANADRPLMLVFWAEW